jgi:hypothetical protein
MYVLNNAYKLLFMQIMNVKLLPLRNREIVEIISMHRQQLGELLNCIQRSDILMQNEIIVIYLHFALNLL